jgi:hypothetical protein
MVIQEQLILVLAEEAKVKIMILPMGAQDIKVVAAKVEAVQD